MRRAGLMGVTITATIIIVISGCSKTERTKPPSSEQPAAYSDAVGTGGAGANLRRDDDFVHDVAVKTMAAVELSRMALDKAADPNIRVFAQMMIDEHGAASAELKSVVSGQGIEWPTQLDERRRKTAEELKKNQGGNFDRDYMEAMVEGHQDLAAKLESRLDVQSVADWTTAMAGRTQSKALPEPITIRDVQVRPNKSDNAVTMRINQWAADTYPVAQKHLDTARTLENAAKQRSPK
jgi:putative membrane protein